MEENKRLRKDLQSMSAYIVDREQCKYKADANESPFPLSKNLKEKLKNYIESENFNIYPDTDSEKLRVELAKFWKVEAENIACGVGADQIIDFIIKALVSENDKVLTLAPTFGMYKITALVNKCSVMELDLEENFDIDSKKIIETINNENIKLFFICSPNNPTGNEIETSKIEEILKNTTIPIVVDEAYGEFGNYSILEKLKDYPNLIVIKTFSKAYALAGARVGYMLAEKDIINAINVIKPPFNLPCFSQFIAIESLKEQERLVKEIEYIKLERDRFYEEIKDLKNFKAYPSAANFIFLKSRKKISDYLKNQGVKVKIFQGTLDYAEFLRIAVGLEEVNNVIIKCLKEFDTVAKEG